VLKGRANYVCRQRLAEVEPSRQLALDGLGEPPRRRARRPGRVGGHHRHRRPGRAGRRALAAASVGGGQRRPASARARPAARAATTASPRPPGPGRSEADVVVVNLHLYGLDLASGGMLPDHDVVVIDEAHQLEDIISATSGLELTGGRFSRPGPQRPGRHRRRPARRRGRGRRPASATPSGRIVGGRLRGALTRRHRRGPCRCPGAPARPGRAAEAVPTDARATTPPASRAGQQAGRAHRRRRPAAEVRADDDVACGWRARRRPRCAWPPSTWASCCAEPVGAAHRRPHQRHRARPSLPDRLGLAPQGRRPSTWAAPSTTRPTRCSTAPRTSPTPAAGLRRGHARRARGPHRGRRRAHPGAVHQLGP
jgi:hypothetical protein